MESIFMTISDDCVTSISSTVETSAYVVVFGENIDKFTLAFIAPLGA
jgi:hypothetical protein